MLREMISHADYSEMLVETLKIDIWMGVKNGKKLGIEEKFQINIYIYILAF